MEVFPNVLTYKGTFVEPLTESLTLTNTTSEPLAFKVKTTAPKLYCVRPNASIIQPGEKAEISVILQGYTTPLPKDFKCKDKFLIVSCPCPDLTDASKVAENWTTLYQQNGQNGSQKKLRVNFIVEGDVRDDTHINETSFANVTQNNMTARDTSIFPNEDTTFAHDKSINPNMSMVNPNTSSMNPNVSVMNPNVSVNPDRTLQETNILPVEEQTKPVELKSDLEDSNTKINTLSEKLDSSEKAPESIAVSPETVSGVSLPFAALLVIIALLLGWYIF